MKTITTGGPPKVDGTRDRVEVICETPARRERHSDTPEIEAKMLNKAATKRKLTRREQRDLDVEISFMEGVVRREPACVEAWRVLSEDYSRRGKFEESLRADEELAKLAPNDPCVLYDLACGYSLNKRIDQAVAAISRAVAKGFKDFRWLLRDPDLTNVRRDPLFKKVWVKISTVQSGVA